MIAVAENMVLNASQGSRFAGLRDQRLCRDIPEIDPRGKSLLIFYLNGERYHEQTIRTNLH
jgi:hypothetical protein